MGLREKFEATRAVCVEAWRRPGSQKSAVWASTLLLLVVMGAYLGVWVQGNWDMLTDPRLQNSDARTSIFPFHRYADGSLRDDPIANEMLALVPIGVHALYRVLVPLTDVFIAPKIVQGIALAILVYAAAVLARSRRAGFGAAALLLFLVLHDWFAVYRIAGGLPRAFGFPLFALWLAGVLGNRPWARRAAPVLSALTYPSVMNMLLAAEGLYALRGLGRVEWSVVGRRLLRFGAVVALCFLAVLPAVVGGDDRGPVHTLAEAQEEPAFGKAGRLWVLPFEEPTGAFGQAFVDQLNPRGKSFAPALREFYDKDPQAFAVGIFAALLLLPFLRATPPPWLALVFFSGTTFIYVLSRVLAFSLYSPERYFSFGMRMASITLLVVLLGQVGYWLRGAGRVVTRNVVAAGFVLAIWGLSGSGVVPRNGMTIDQRTDRSMYEFIAQLPKDVRFASHPMDGDGIPYYSARATMGAFETLQPWFTKSWRAQRERCEDTLQAMYATDVAVLRDYVQKHGVTHFLVNTRRYEGDVADRSESFEPFTEFSKELLSGVEASDLLFKRLPRESVVFRLGRWRVVDAELLLRELESRQ